MSRFFSWYYDLVFILLVLAIVYGIFEGIASHGLTYQLQEVPTSYHNANHGA